jgi:DNA-binding GntR family transcriptional regulator
MARTENGRNRIGATYERLRGEILGGTLEPGARLKPAEIAERFKVSVPVVREALTRLVGDRVVVSVPHQGFSVMSLNAVFLEQHTEARSQVDGLAARLATERGDLEWEATVVGSLHRLLSTPLRSDEGAPLSDAWAAADQNFHHAIAAGCGNAVLIDLRDQLASATKLLIHWAAACAPARNAVDEHQGIADAALARDGDLLAARIDAHYRRTSGDLLAIVGR